MHRFRDSPHQHRGCRHQPQDDKKEKAEEGQDGGTHADCEQGSYTEPFLQLENTPPPVVPAGHVALGVVAALLAVLDDLLSPAAAPPFHSPPLVLSPPSLSLNAFFFPPSARLPP